MNRIVWILMVSVIGTSLLAPAPSADEKKKKVKKITVPSSISGKSLSRAKELLEKAGFTNIKFEENRKEKDLKKLGITLDPAVDRVKSFSPRGSLAPDTEIKLFPVRDKTPGVVGLTLTKAQALVDKIGGQKGTGVKLTLTPTTLPTTSKRKDGVIAKQDPARGALLKSGTINVTVYKYEPKKKK